MTAQPFPKKDIQVVTYNTCDPEIRERFEQWLLSMTPDVDNEASTGPSNVLDWVRQQNALLEPDGLYQTFIFLDAASGQLLATRSIVPDDRDIGKTYSIAGDGFLGFLNVHRDHRGRGLGEIIAEHTEQHVQRFADKWGRPVTMHFFTANDLVRRIWEPHGYRLVRNVFVAAFGSNRDLYEKTYHPSGDGSLHD